MLMGEKEMEKSCQVTAEQNMTEGTDARDTLRGEEESEGVCGTR